MAHLWMQTQRDGKLEWGLLPLAGAHKYRLNGEPHRPPELDPSDAATGGALVLAADATGSAWVLMTAQPATAVRVNGQLLAGGLRALRDRDEVVVNGTRVFFSSEELAKVEHFPGSSRPARCPRCQNPIESSAPAVKCPKCGVWSHETSELPCWSYPAHPRCAACGQPAALDAGYQWTPHELG